MSLTSDRWEVLLQVPQDIGDLGLHQPEDLAAAHFRRQLVEELGAEHAARVGPEAERQFRRARAVYTDRPVLWAGFVMTSTPAGAGVAPDTSAWPAAERERLTELAATTDAMLITLAVGVRELTLPDGPSAPATLLSRAIKARFGDSANVHLVRYGDVPGVAVVRTHEADRDGLESAGFSGAEQLESAGPEATGAELLVAEVNLLFPDDDALVTVTATTPNGGALDDAVLLAGTLARGVRVRPADPQVRAEREASAAGGSPAGDDGAASPAAPPAPAAPLAVVLPGGQLLPEGLTLLGRAPERTAQLPADHTVTVPDDSISRTHLALLVTSGTVSATDLHSTNGTLLRRPDGQISRLVPGEQTELAAGDEVNLGAALLRVVRRP